MATIDLVDNFQVTRKQMSKQVDWPSLQSLRKHSVVGVGARAHADVPGLDTSRLKDVSVWSTRHGIEDERCFLTVSQPSFSSSTRTLISSGMAMAGWVSFSWMATWTRRATDAVTPEPSPRAEEEAVSRSNNKWGSVSSLNYFPVLFASPCQAVCWNRCEQFPWSQTWRPWNGGWCLAGWQILQSTPASDGAPFLQRTVGKDAYLSVYALQAEMKRFL